LPKTAVFIKNAAISGDTNNTTYSNFCGAAMTS
jgi:hypothetical protein